jgi:hypothetical protein
MRAELGNLFWLQWRLTRASFRSRRTSVRLHVLGLLFRLITFTFTLPMFVMMGIGLAVMLAMLSSRAAYEVVMAANTLVFLMWLVLPASYSSQLVERFEMSRLFSYPISFRSIVVGSTLMSLLTMTGFWTIPIILGEVVGLTWHQPLALPLILLGTLPTFALLVLTGRIMDDFLDLVAGDRRLRALMLALLGLPFILCWVGQYAIQVATEDFSSLPQVAQVPFPEELERELTKLDQASGVGELRDSLSRVIEIVRVSRLLIWLPPGWATAGMALAASGDWGRALLFLALSTTFVALLLRAHAGITRRLMQGAALSAGVERVRSHKWHRRLPGPPAFWALFRKDWLYLWRSPLPRRMMFSSLLVAVVILLPMQRASQGSAAPGGGGTPPVREVASLTSAVFIITMIGMSNIGLAANYFGAIDREGFATLASSPLDRRYTILSANLAILLYMGAQVSVVSLVIALVTGYWPALPLGLYLGLCLQIGGAPAHNLAAIIGPYRTQLKFSRGRQRGNLWGIVTWLMSAPPILAAIVLPLVFWRPGLVFTLPLGAMYSLGLYALTLKPLARLLQRREHAILGAVIAEE